MIAEKFLGNPKNKIWIVSSCPKRGDTSGPLSSSIGSSFVRYFSAHGVQFPEIHFDYIVNKIPPPGQIRNGVGWFKQTGELEDGLVLLKDKIKKYKPNLILGLGADTLQYLQGERAIAKWRGHPVYNEELKCKFLFTFDPYHAHAQRRVDKKQKPGQYKTLMEADIRRAVKEMQFSKMELADPKLVVGASYTETMTILQDMEENARIISYDIEVFKPYEGRLIDCIGLADNLGRGLCIPFYISQGTKAIRYWRSDTEFHSIILMVKRLMESNIPKVAQNSQFDTTILAKYYDIKVNNLIWDTMVVQHALYCDLPKDLGTLISLYTNLSYHKYMIHSSSSIDRWLYNAADAVANLHVMQGQIAEFFDHAGLPVPEKREDGGISVEIFKIPAIRHYYKVVHPTIDTTVQMHINGVKVDLSLRDSVLDIEYTRMKQIQGALNQIFPFPLHADKKKSEMFNPMSSKQKNILFYEILGCPKQTVKGKVKCDKHAMRILLGGEKRPFVKTLLKACLEYRAADTRLGKFKVEPDNGYIRTQYDVTGTDTGRLASKKSDVMLAGTNLQNNAKGPQRAMLVPEDDEEFALIDLYAAEAYLNALDAGEIDMLRMISGLDETDIIEVYGCRKMSAKTAKKYKIHNWMQRTTQESWPKECKKVDYTYKKAKQSIHALNYGVMPDKMSRESGLPRGVCDWQYTMYHNKFPGIQARMKRINGQLRMTKCLTSPLGRRRFFLMDICHELFNMAYAWPSQSTIGEITEIAGNYLYMMSELSLSQKKIPWCRPVLNTHDGLVIRIKKGTRDAVILYILQAFNIPMLINKTKITIPVSIGFGPNFQDMKEEEVYFYELDI